MKATHLRGLPLAALLATSALPAQATSTDVWLAPLSRRGDSVIVGVPRNVTNRPGYDNQPSFTLDSRAILYTSTREDGQADIYRYDIPSGTTARLTSTPESEYSATVTPDGRHFSVIRVERDSTQRLWKFPLSGGEPSLVLEQVKPVGYHAWLDDSTLALFVLGRPATLQIADSRSGRAVAITGGIGRGLQRSPGERAVAFVARDSTTMMLSSYRVDPSSASATSDRVVVLHRWTPLPRNDFFAFVDSRTVIAGRGEELLTWSAWGVVGGAAAAWVRVASIPGVRDITRLAVSPDGRWLAFVAEPAP